MRCRKNPDITGIIKHDCGIVMRIIGFLVQQDCWTGKLSCRVIIITNHMQKNVFILELSSIAEKGLVYLLGIKSIGQHLLRISGKATTVFIMILIFRRLIIIPDATITIVFSLCTC